jgi:hypothetical protein
MQFVDGLVFEANSAELGSNEVTLERIQGLDNVEGGCVEPLHKHGKFAGAVGHMNVVL